MDRRPSRCKSRSGRARTPRSRTDVASRRWRSSCGPNITGRGTSAACYRWWRPAMAPWTLRSSSTSPSAPSARRWPPSWHGVRAASRRSPSPSGSSGCSAATTGRRSRTWRGRSSASARPRSNAPCSIPPAVTAMPSSLRSRGRWRATAWSRATAWLPAPSRAPCAGPRTARASPSFSTCFPSTSAPLARSSAVRSGLPARSGGPPAATPRSRKRFSARPSSRPAWAHECPSSTCSARCGRTRAWPRTRSRRTTACASPPWC
mmetsp:Transcript_19793/g.66556  ORF Transcript_19793/g.66556 Transcript_19793/m.66556 type:complete len:262 (-) Transcript_19793:332-1117(-)